MGATDFTHQAAGSTPQEAFANAVSEAQYDYGHAGYTGTIAEKDGYVMVSGELPRALEDAEELAQKMINEDDERISDKWGPAGCIPIVGGSYLFFGWASS